MENDFKILELFSGIGGMHYAFEYSKLSGEVVAAFDINTVANLVYTHNYATTVLKNNNIQSLNSKTIQKLNANLLLMSPPCQPFTRVGNQLDLHDKRSDALQHLCELLPECPNIRFVLMENVKGFEKSQARERFLMALRTSGFHYCEFILSPSQFGVPNTRYRYYCLARKDRTFAFTKNIIIEEIPAVIASRGQLKIILSDILEPESSVSNEVLVNDKDLLKRVLLMDIVTADDSNTMCFTKGYTHYAEGTGSVFTPLTRAEVNEIFQKLKNFGQTSSISDDKLRLQLLRQLRLRYFTPREVARLMCFPESFEFPPTVTNRQKYRLLGNSINVLVVGELIKILCT